MLDHLINLGPADSMNIGPKVEMPPLQGILHLTGD